MAFVLPSSVRKRELETGIGPGGMEPFGARWTGNF